ncbi:hypothetical protein DENSPDRAFT_619478 [Dentipellis sp. KUC8613]|nr:hypothetical protein DENSPDRAFT_619478 [Dentipellis sp. KUC8613]
MPRALNTDVLRYMTIFLDNRDIFCLSITHRAAYEALLPLTWSNLAFTECYQSLRCCRSLMEHKDHRIRFIRRIFISYSCIVASDTQSPRTLMYYLCELLRLAVNLHTVTVRHLKTIGFNQPARKTLEALACLRQLSTMSLSVLSRTTYHVLSRFQTNCLRSIELELDPNLTDITDFLRPFQDTLEEISLSAWPTRYVTHFAPICFYLVINNDDVWPHVHTLGLRGISVLSPSTLVHAFPQVQSLCVYNERRDSVTGRRPCAWPSLTSVEAGTLGALDELVDWERTGHIDRLDLSASSVHNRERMEKMPWGSAMEIPHLERVLGWTSPRSFSIALAAPMPSSFFDTLKIAAPQLGHLGIYYCERQHSASESSEHFGDKELGDLLPLGMEELPITSLRLHLHVGDRLQTRIKNIILQRLLPKLPRVEYVHYISQSDEEDTAWRVIRSAEGSVQLADVPDDQQYVLKRRGGFS